MSRDNQIEEMAKILIDYKNKNHIMASTVILADYAEELYNAGYRKQEWVSVEDRKPSESGKYIVCSQKGSVYQTKYYLYPENKGGHWGQKDKGKNITHWMPLPEPPKIKGGE
jgi:hypothetical protein